MNQHSNTYNLRSHLLSNDIGDIDITKETPINNNSQNRIASPNVSPEFQQHQQFQQQQFQQQQQFSPRRMQQHQYHQQQFFPQQYHQQQQQQFSPQRTYSPQRQMRKLPSKDVNNYNEYENKQKQKSHSINQNTLTKIFKGKKSFGKSKSSGGFDDDNDDDIEINATSDAELSFTDIGSTVFNNKFNHSTDSTPMIPTLITGKHHENMSNTEYRKYQTAQKKTALNAINRQQQQQQQQQPRTMSLQNAGNMNNNQVYKAQSMLNSNINQRRLQADFNAGNKNITPTQQGQPNLNPRAMSLTNNRNQFQQQQFLMNERMSPQMLPNQQQNLNSNDFMTSQNNYRENSNASFISTSTSHQNLKDTRGISGGLQVLHLSKKQQEDDLLQKQRDLEERERKLLELELEEKEKMLLQKERELNELKLSNEKLNSKSNEVRLDSVNEKVIESPALETYKENVINNETSITQAQPPVEAPKSESVMNGDGASSMQSSLEFSNSKKSLFSKSKNSLSRISSSDQKRSSVYCSNIEGFTEGKLADEVTQSKDSYDTSQEQNFYDKKDIVSNEFDFDNTIAKKYEPVFTTSDNTVSVNPFKTITITNEQLQILNEGKEMIKDLKLLSGELAESIERENNLEQRLADIELNKPTRDKKPLAISDFQIELRKKSEKIVELIQMLTEERMKRHIAEEQVLLRENGVQPSTLELVAEIERLKNKISTLENAA
ncbi:hypothetical protein TPHA_0G02745 [Tetrapisispora phaffii CBS 4417]|uniref:Uncharacterized protein n=1 Tax=Tetrapisispora phaffii (strain ATCC 24235 / CBS 4417 / NBRC 1672 / NRRL Y-8282 / UCD 70-5) TaxID=1071381 RepID=G8BW34_TETPH|nr:hypothetical protein TPHA_0G02745 [Tetrapisispora phaffii CBS 4417]CCE64112.1 hypothetical protein TPHA_0G02745 [Tetrapisispora phaffii CBS 4417]